MKTLLAGIAKDFGTPCYVYDIDKLKSRATDTRAAFASHFKLSYAVKANPNLSLLVQMKNSVDMLDISSGGELKRTMATQWDPEKISFTGPAKTDTELYESVEARIGEIILESVNEAERLSAIAARAGVVQPVLLRISPIRIPAGFGSTMAGRPTPFGIDEEVAESALDQIRGMKSLRVKGFHIYAGTQCLKADSIVENLESCMRLFRKLCEKADFVPEKLIFGSGLGIPYHLGDEPLDINAIGNAINPQLKAFRESGRFANTDLVLELGRYLIGEAGYYLMRVLNIKKSRGATLCICDGGMHHHLAASGHLGSVIPRNYQMFKTGADTDSDANLQPYELCGPLCTSIDRIGRAVKLPNLCVGDVIAIKSSGAYGITASPMHFISHAPPKEIMFERVDERWKVEDISELKMPV
ncbi:MAG: type III PLP-dependent enzyme [Verrucomicrobia bacterium]|nr:type III PLP-dependent enzyme [Verrucomicrobiota bacterium]